MSVVSLARTAGVTSLLSNNRSPIVNSSFVEADINMMSTKPPLTISRIMSRYSANDRNFHSTS
jgi:hypothetical protein